MHFEPSERMVKLLLFLLFGSAYFIISDYNLSTSMDTEVFRTAKNLIDNGSFGLNEKALVCKMGLDGKYYYVEGLLVMLSGAFFYLLAKVFGLFPRATVAVMNQAIMPVACIILYAICKRLGYSRRTSLWLTIIFGFGTMAFVHAKFLFPEPLTIVFFLAAVYCLIRFRQEGTNKWAFLCGGFTGATILVRTDAVFFILGISLGVLYLLWQKMKDRSLFPARQALVQAVVYGLPLLFSFAVFFYYNYARFGNVFDSGYAMEYQILGEELKYPARLFAFGETLKGFLGMWIIPNRSMFFINPVLIFVFFAIRRFWKEYRFESLVLGFIFCEYVYLYANRGPAGFAGSAAWGMRYMLPMVPFMVLPIGLFLEDVFASKNRKKGLRVFFYVVLAVSIAIQLLGASVNYQDVQVPAEEVFGAQEARLKLMMDPRLSLVFQDIRGLNMYGPYDMVMIDALVTGEIPVWAIITFVLLVIIFAVSAYLISRLLFFPDKHSSKLRKGAVKPA